MCRDNYSPMYPSSITLIVFGILAASLALLAELFVASFTPAISLTLESTLSFGAFLTLLGAAIIEEVSKYLFLHQYAKRFSAPFVPSVKRSLSLGALFGIGFAAPEIFLATGVFLSSPALTFPSMLAVHVATSIIFALFLFSALYQRLAVPKKRLFASYLVASAILLHTLYNLYILLFS